MQAYFILPMQSLSKQGQRGLIWSIWTGSGLQPQPIVLCRIGWPIHHALLPVSPPRYLHCHWFDTTARWWIADSMRYDKIERSVCVVHRPVISAQLGTHHSYKAGLFNIPATVRGPCGQYPSACLINVSSLTRLLQSSSSPLANNYSNSRALTKWAKRVPAQFSWRAPWRKKGTTFKERSDKCYDVVPVFFFFDC